MTLRALCGMALLVCGLTACGGGGNAQAPSDSPPAPGIHKVYFGYYGTMGAQVAETLPHISLLWESQFEGEDAAVAHMQQALLPTVLDVSAQVYAPSPTTFTLRPDAARRLHTFLQRLHDADLLRYVVALYPIDEPDMSVGDEATIRAANRLIRETAYQFFELHEVPLAVIYSGASRLTAIDDFNWVGFDDYDAGARAAGDLYDRMRARLRDGQRTLLIPGGAFRQDPAPFVDTAGRSEVIAMVVFLWFDNWDQKGASGVRSNGLFPAYCAAGAALSGKSASLCPPLPPPPPDPSTDR
jgi:hypothetical protein